MKQISGMWPGLCLVAVGLASCGFPPLGQVTGGDDAGPSIGAGDDAGGTPGGGNDSGPNTGSGDAAAGDDAGAPIDAAPPSISLELIAGDIGGIGNGDGDGSAARFDGPTGVAVDGAGNVYIVDHNNHTIRKLSAAGTVTTLAGSPGVADSLDGTGAAARFNNPTGIAVDTGGTIYVADQDNHTIRKVTAAGDVTTMAGSAGIPGSVDATGGAARFNFPAAVAVDAAGNVYVADSNNQTIRKITATGAVTTLAGTAGARGNTDGAGAVARFSNPAAVAVDAADNLYVADHDNNTIRKVTGSGVVTTLAGTAGATGSTDGAGTAARFRSPSGVTADRNGTLYVADQDNSTIRKITATGAVTTLAGSATQLGSDDGAGTVARFRSPAGVGIDAAGNVYVADQDNSLVRKITAAGSVTTLAGAVGQVGAADGPGAIARFSFPAGVATDAAGDLYVADSNNRIVRRITSSGAVTTLAGAPGVSGELDGTGTAARFSFPAGIAVDAAGTVYLADESNHSIRKISPAGAVTTFAGSSGTPGSADGTGTAAQFSFPNGVAIDGAGTLYVADQGNHTIRKVTADGVVTTLAGSPGALGSADGVGSAARFRFPAGVVVDSAGTLYVADGNNHTIRKVTPGGAVTTLAGAAGIPGSADGTGTTARFRFPSALAIDGADNLYVADRDNATLRKVTPTGTTTTLAGIAGVTGIVLGATPRFAGPRGLVILGDSLAVSDANAILRLHRGAP